MPPRAPSQPGLPAPVGPDARVRRERWRQLRASFRARSSPSRTSSGPRITRRPTGSSRSIRRPARQARRSSSRARRPGRRHQSTSGLPTSALRHGASFPLRRTSEARCPVYPGMRRSGRGARALRRLQDGLARVDPSTGAGTTGKLGGAASPVAGNPRGHQASTPGIAPGAHDVGLLRQATSTYPDARARATARGWLGVAPGWRARGFDVDRSVR